MYVSALARRLRLATPILLDFKSPSLAPASGEYYLSCAPFFIPD